MKNNKIKTISVTMVVLFCLFSFLPSGFAAQTEADLTKGMEIKAKVDFEDLTEGDSIELSDKTSDWYLYTASVALIDVDKDGNKYAAIEQANHEFQMQYAEDLSKTNYVFTVDAKMNGIQDGLFVKGCEPIYRVNPAWQDYEMKFCSSTYYVQNGGKSVKWNGMGGSGMYISPKDENTMYIFISTFEKDGIFAAHRNCAIPVQANIVSETCKYLFTDDNKGKIQCYVNGELFATVEYSDETTYPLDTDDTAKTPFYKNVVVKDAGGNSVLTVENSRLSPRNVVAVAERGSNFEFDNVTVYAPDDGINATEKPTAEVTATPAVTETATVQPTESTSVPSQSAVVQEPTTTAAIQTTAPVEEPKEGLSAGIIALIAVGCAAVLAGTAVFIIKKKKKTIK